MLGSDETALLIQPLGTAELLVYTRERLGQHILLARPFFDLLDQARLVCEEPLQIRLKQLGVILTLLCMKVVQARKPCSRLRQT